METPAQEQQPSSPPTLMPPNLSSPEPSRTPELTSRSLNRASDGYYAHSLGPYRSDKKFFDDKSDDDYNVSDEDWRRNIYTEPRDYEKETDTRTRIKELMQEKSEFYQWVDLAATMESELAENPGCTEEVHLLWAPQEDSNSKQNEKVTLSTNREIEEQPSLRLNSKLEKPPGAERRIDGCTPIHEEYNSDGETTDASQKVEHHQPHREDFEQVTKSGEEFLSETVLRQELLMLVPSSYINGGEGQFGEIFQNMGDITGPHHNEEQFCGYSFPPSDRMNLLQKDKQSGLITISSLGGDALHKLLGERGVASALWPEQKKNIASRDKIVELVVRSPKTRKNDSHVMNAQSSTPKDDSHVPCDPTCTASAPAFQCSSLTANGTVVTTSGKFSNSTDQSQAFSRASAAHSFEILEVTDRKSKSQTEASDITLPQKCIRIPLDVFAKQLSPTSHKSHSNYSLVRSVKLENAKLSETQFPTLQRDNLRRRGHWSPPLLRNSNIDKRHLRVGRSLDLHRENPRLVKSSSRSREQESISVLQASYLRKSHPPSVQPWKAIGGQGAPISAIESRVSRRHVSGEFKYPQQYKESQKQSSTTTSQRLTRDLLGHAQSALIRKSTNPNYARKSAEPQNGQRQSRQIEPQKHREIFVRTIAKGRSNEELEDRFLELDEKVASIRPSHEDGGVRESSTTPSIMQMPYCHQFSEVKEVEELNEQVTDSNEPKNVLAQRLLQQRREFERISRAKDKLWEAKLGELQKDKYELQIRLQALGIESPRERIKRSGDKNRLTDEEIILLRQEIAEQEALINGYQTENERAFKRLKEQESNFRERVQLMTEENARLASQLASMQFSMRVPMYGTSPDASQEIQALRRDLQALHTSEASLKFELEKERKANKELDKSLIRLIQEKEQEHGTLKNMIAEERLEHAQAIDVKEEQNKLYIDSQELVNSLRSTVEDQASIIAELRRKYEVVDGKEDIGKENDTDCREEFQLHKGWNSIQKAKAVQQIEALQKQVKKLEAALRQRSDPSAGTQRCKLSADGKDVTIRRLRDELSALQRRIRQDDSVQAFQTLRQEHEKLKHEYITRVHDLTQQLKREKVAYENDTSSRKDKFVDKQVEDLRTFYVKKVRELTKQLEEVRKGNTKILSKVHVEAKGAADKLAGKVNEKRVTEQVAKLEDTLSSKEAMIKNLEQKIKELETKKGDDKATTNFAEVAALQKQLEAAEIARQLIQKTCTEAMERAAMMTVKHQQKIKSLQEAHAAQIAEIQKNQIINRSSISEADCQRYKYHELERENRALDSRVKTQLEDLGGEAFARPISPRMAQLRTLRRKLEDMEDLQKAKETEWRRLSQDVKRRLFGLDASEGPEGDQALEQNWQAAMEAKNLEIRNFRLELDLVMQEALAFQQSELQMESMQATN